MGYRYRLVMQNRLSEMEKVNKAIEFFSGKTSLSVKTAQKLGIVLDELVSNIILYGFDKEDSGDIIINFRNETDSVEVVIKHSGKPFDPTTAPAPDLNSSIEDRKIGGLGIHIVLKLTETFRYQLQNGVNIIKLSIKTNQ